MFKTLNKVNNSFRELVLDEDRRMKMQFVAVCMLLAFVSGFMTVVNIFTDKTVLMWSTLVFTLLCALNVVLTRCFGKMKLAVMLFQVEFLVLLTFFIVSGTPEGFSAIWAALLPTGGLLLFQRKKGTILSAAMFCIIIFFFWTPIGRSFLQYSYTESFLLRFPFLFAAFYVVALFFEIVRQTTYDQYRFLYTHDALTGAFNRRGFTDHAAEVLKANQGKKVGMLIFDLDYFKSVNDTYGHQFGDKVLIAATNALRVLTSPEICRWGGEEFAVILPDCDLSGSALQKICDDFGAHDFIIEDKNIPLHVSVGAVIADCTEKTTIDQLCSIADDCLYKAKECGRSQGIMSYL